MEVLRREGEGWEVHDTIPFEDGLSTGLAGLTNDGRTLYMRDSRGRDTSALFAIDAATGQRTLLHADPRADELDILAPERVATFVAWLASPAAATVNGQVFVVYGDMVALMAAPVVERKFTSAAGAFTLDELDAQVAPYFADRSPRATFAAYAVGELDTTGVQTLAR